MFFRKKDKDAQQNKVASEPVSTTPIPQPAAPPPAVAAASPQPASAPAASAPVPAQAASVATAPAASATLPPEELTRRADYSHRIMQSFGSIMAVYARSKTHRQMRLGDIEAIVGPAVTSGQFSLGEATHNQNGLVTPVAAVLWASVSAEIDQRLLAELDKPLNLTEKEWKSGDTIWIVDAIGEPQVISAIMKRLQEAAWKNRVVKARTRGADGRAVAQTLQQKTAA